MSTEKCPFCDTPFDNRGALYSGGLRGLFRLQSADDNFTVRCPNCGRTYVSESVKFLGLVRRKYFYWVLLGIVLLVAIGAVLDAASITGTPT
jgi:hypothetical protein